MEKVWVLFYGTFMSARILREYGIECEETIPASVLQRHNAEASEPTAERTVNLAGTPRRA